MYECVCVCVQPSCHYNTLPTLMPRILYSKKKSLPQTCATFTFWGGLVAGPDVFEDYFVDVSQKEESVL